VEELQKYKTFFGNPEEDAMWRGKIDELFGEILECGGVKD